MVYEEVSARKRAERESGAQALCRIGSAGSALPPLTKCGGDDIIEEAAESVEESSAERAAKLSARTGE